MGTLCFAHPTLAEALKDVSIQENSANFNILLNAIKGLGDIYAKLAPVAESTAISAADADYAFLDILWRLQIPGANGRYKDSTEIATQLDQAVNSLKNLLQRIVALDVANPQKQLSLSVQSFNFINNLFQSASKTVPLNQVLLASDGSIPQGSIPNLKKASFLRELLQFGFEVAKTNPSIPVAGVSGGFASSLWQSINSTQMRQETKEFNYLLKSFDNDTSQQNLFPFLTNLLQVSKYTEGVQLPEWSLDAIDGLILLGQNFYLVDSTAQDPGTSFHSIGDLWLATSNANTDPSTGLDPILIGIKAFLDELSLEDVLETLEDVGKQVKELEDIMSDLANDITSSGKENLQAFLDNYEQGYIPHGSNEGSGAYAQAKPTIDDYTFRIFLDKVFLNGSIFVGYLNARSHLEHYLNGGGRKYNMNVRDLYDKVPSVKRRFDPLFEEAIEKAEALNLSNLEKETLLDKGNGSGRVRREEVPDWFYAMGEYRYEFESKAALIEYQGPSEEDPQIAINVILIFRVLDEYNWDQYKTLPPFFGVRFSDKMFGRLHQRGLAKEFDMEGAIGKGYFRQLSPEEL